MTGLTLSGEALSASNDYLAKALTITSGGRTAIRDEYDFYLLHGLELSVMVPLALLKQQRIEGVSPRWPESGTEDAFRRSVETALRETLAVKILAMLRAIATVPAFVSPMPIADVQMSALRGRLTERGFNASLVQMFESLSRDIVAGFDATFIPQPMATRDTDGIATQGHHSQQPARFTIQQPGDHDKHMDAEYGAAVLRDFFAAAPGACE